VLEIKDAGKFIVWFCVQEIIEKKTKNGKTFYRLKVTDDKNNTGWVRFWGKLPNGLVEFTIWLAEVGNDKSWGASTSGYKLRPLVTE